MKKFFILLCVCPLLAAAGCQKTAAPQPGVQSNTMNQIATMTISSPNFSANGTIPNTFTCAGEGVSPALRIFNIPAAAQSLALIVDDPDAPSGTFTHWLVWNINPITNQIPENGAPDGAIQGQNSGGKTGYYAPCPPSGTHHYHFRIYALDAQLNVPAGSSRQDLEAAMNNHIVGQGDLVGTVTYQGQ